MFEQSTLSKAPAGKRLWTTGIGFAGQAAVLSLMFVVPMMWPQVLPRVTFTELVIPPRAPSAPVRDMAVVRPRGPAFSSQVTHGLYDPGYIPPKPAILIDAPSVSPGPAVPGAIPGGGGAGGAGDGVLVQIINSGTPAPQLYVEKPRAATAAPAAAQEPKRIQGGVVRMAQALHRVEPEYPQIARAMRLEGVVELVGVIGVDGRMREVRVLSGHPILAREALKAVSQWTYEPTTLNGVPVEVTGPITVTFRLSR